MTKRLFLSFFVAFVACGMFFYVAYFAGLIYTAATGPLNPANAFQLQWVLRHVALPISVALGLVVFIFAFHRFDRDRQRPPATADKS